jgi:aminoglycoside/choline kinase family phosphotransferase
VDPDAATTVTDAWLASALGAPIEPITVEPIAAGVGLLATLVRVRTASGRRFVVKQPSTDAANRSIATRFGYYAREAGTYAALLPRAGVVTPVCHAVVDGAHGPVLVLDDLAPRRPGDQLAGATVAEVYAAATSAATIHAAFWNDPALAACSWLPGPRDPVVAGYGRLFELVWDEFCARVADDIPAAHLAAAEQAITRFPAVCEHFAHAPRTLVHGDFRLDNLMFDAGGAAAAIDWQLAAWGRGPYDLALFLAGSVEPAVRRPIEADVVAHYHSVLAGRGVEDYSLDDCRRDYRRGHVLNLPNPVTALVAVAPGTERGAALLAANARRALAAIADHEPGPTLDDQRSAEPTLDDQRSVEPTL